MENTLLVTVYLDSDPEKNNWSPQDSSGELCELTRSTGAKVADEIICNRHEIASNLYIGKGKAEEIAIICQESSIDTVIFNNDLTPVQQRNLEEIIGRKIIDRTQLILDIFARNAKSPEGKIQVELAQLQYLMPRLTGKGTMLSRLGGGIGTRGPGEQKLEIDRRTIRKRIDKLKDELMRSSLHRLTLSKKRKKNAVPTVALVGYTSAGKSTLLNALTNAGQRVSKGLFTTLDPLYKSLDLPNGNSIVISDTVGFLHNLPHHLIESFKATLDEVKEADLIINVLDISHPKFNEHNRAVYEVLEQLESADKPMITVLNKIDLLSDTSWLGSLCAHFPNSVAISALNKQNIPELLEKIEQQISSLITVLDLLIPLNRMDLVDRVYQEGKVLSIEYSSDGVHIKASLPVLSAKKLSAYQKKSS